MRTAAATTFLAPAATLAAALAVAGCSGPAADDDAPPAEVAEQPGDVRVDADTEFGAATRFTSAIPVRAPDHDDRDPEDRRYEAVVWRDGSLVFQVNGERWVLDPGSGEVRREG